MSGLTFLMQEVEVPLIEVVVDMEDAGYLIDAGYFHDLKVKLEQRRDSVLSDLKDIGGNEFNPGSPPQVASLLYDRLGLPVTQLTDGGSPSTSEAVLKQVDHPAAQQIIEHRGLSKLISSYCNKIPSEVGEDGRLHGDFNQMGAETGRFTCRGIMQTIPKREGEYSIRRGFRAPPGKMIVAADFDQQELKVLAAISADEAMLQAVRDGVDLHGLAAVRVFGLDCEPNDVAKRYPEQRRRVKAIQFGIIYGQSTTRLAETLGIKRQDAQRLQDDYFSRFPGVKACVDDAHARVIRDGHIDDIFGRRRYLPDAQVCRPRKRWNTMSAEEQDVVRRLSRAKRAAQNFIIQGPAATITKLAMLRCHKHLQAEHPEIAMILQVHDELHFEVPDSEVAHFARELPALMCTLDLERFGFSVPLSVTIQAGPSWGELHVYEDDNDAQED